MMKNLVLKILVALSFPTCSYGQINLVLNPSLENYSTCPDNEAEINYAINWRTFGGTTDYFNECSSYPDFGVPNNWGGFQLARSGVAYGAVGTYLKGITGLNNVREYAGGTLSTSLTIGVRYYVSFHVNLSLNQGMLFNTASNNLGANFSTVLHSDVQMFPITNMAMINYNNIITDTVGWFKIFGSFVADSAYQYVVIGNFFDDLNTDTLSPAGCDTCTAYYFFDDVCVSIDSAYAYNYIGIEDYLTIDVQVFPNPTSNKVILKFDFAENYPIEFCILNSLGQVLSNLKTVQPAGPSIYEIDLSMFSPGIYYLQLRNENKTLTKKIIKT